MRLFGSYVKTEIFILPGVVLVLLTAGILKAPYALQTAVVIGLLKIVFESYKNIREGRYSLDYIACTAMAVSLYSGEYVAGAIIALMFTGGEALDDFASNRAYTALKALGETIPKNCLVLRGTSYHETPIQDVREGDVILIKHGEIVPLDGTVRSPAEALLNAANLTGEPETIVRKTGTFIESGSVNVGATIELAVVGDFSSSTYHRIAELVEDAQAHPARMVRLSERANLYFTVITFAIAGITYAFTGDVVRLLAVLVIATPCPLIIAAPVAFISGMSRAARAGIILRRPAAFEGIARAHTVFFDKTGTLTLGEPRLQEIEIVPHENAIQTQNEALAIAAGIEIHSLHPLGRALVAEATRRNVRYEIASTPQEQIGRGIAGVVGGAAYTVSGAERSERGITLSLARGDTELAQFHFVDILKQGATRLISDLRERGVRVAIITGDRKENAEKVFRGLDAEILARQSPEDKHRLIQNAQAQGDAVVMVGDGLNDAPALARANVGIVFSGTENGASIEAADVAMLGHDMDKLAELFAASRRTVGIARQSIYGGIAASTLGMVFAALGMLPPVTGALLQEVIDIVVILNALRALRSSLNRG